MIGLDTNVVVDYLVAEQPRHGRVRTWLDEQPGPLVTTATTMGEVLRLLSHPRVFTRPATLAQAVAALELLLECRAIRVVEESPTWWKDLGALASAMPALRGNEVFDARIALCLRFHGVRAIASYDPDFDKYRFLKRVEP
jgi:toxin-antitoxin system PIN domain toxin